MSTAKRLSMGFAVAVLAVLISAAALFIPATAQKAYAMEPSMSVNILKPIDGGNPDLLKYKEVTLESMSIFGTCTAKGAWTHENGGTIFEFRPGQTYKYTITATAAGGFAAAIADPEFKFIFADAKLNNVKATISSDYSTLTLVGTYIYYTPSACSDLKILDSNTDSVTLYWDVNDLDNAIACNIYRNGKNVKTIKTSSYAANHIQTISIPYGPTHEIYVRAVDQFGNLGAASNTIKVKAPKVATPGAMVTKISANKVSIAWFKPAKATGIQVYANGKLIKSTSKEQFVYSAKGAAKKKYYIKAYVKTSDGKIWPSAKSKTKSPVKNVKTATTYGPTHYGYNLKNYISVAKLWYSKANSKGTVKAKFAITNTWKFVSTQTVKATIKIKSRSGKKIASQTFTVGGVKPWSKKTFTVTFNKSVKEQDLVSAGMTYTCKVIR